MGRTTGLGCYCWGPGQPWDMELPGHLKQWAQFQTSQKDKNCGNAGARAAISPHHQAGEESGEQNIQRRAKIDVFAQPGEKAAQEIMMNSCCILGKIFFHKNGQTPESLEVFQLNGTWSQTPSSNETSFGQETGLDVFQSFPSNLKYFVILW